jgi:hypothetical protein
MTEEQPHIKYRNLESVVVKKTDLLTRVRENRDEHSEIFEKAYEGWKEAATEALRKAYTAAKKGEEYRTRYVYEEPPSDYTADYDQAITMLEMSQDEELELSNHDFARYVMDRWEWQGEFLKMSGSWSIAARQKAERMRLMERRF